MATCPPTTTTTTTTTTTRAQWNNKNDDNGTPVTIPNNKKGLFFHQVISMPARIFITSFSRTTLKETSRTSTEILRFPFTDMRSYKAINNNISIQSRDTQYQKALTISATPSASQVMRVKTL